jgi:hypothetical protein
MACGREQGEDVQSGLCSFNVWCILGGRTRSCFRVRFLFLCMVPRPNALVFPLDVQPFSDLAVLCVEVSSTFVQSFGVLLAVFARNGYENSN